MEYEASAHDDLERLLHGESAEPRELPLSLLRAITNDFAASREIGSNGYSEVYKGVLPSRKLVAVKKFYETATISDRLFENELGCLMRVKHKNIVRVLGYCADTQGKALTYEGNFVVADVRHRLLCFEYPTGGILDAYISDASHGLGWRKRYKIIKGICEGLYYLHQNLTVHLDLKPANIWLDEKKAPKIHVYCDSRHLDEKQSKVITDPEYMLLSMGTYWAPEFLEHGVITMKGDIYSLGVLIAQIVTGKRQYSAVENILASWRDIFGTSLEDTRLEQIRVCAEIGKSCLEKDPEKRPDVEHIIQMLVETEGTDEFAEPDEMETVDEFTPDDEQIMELTILNPYPGSEEQPRKLDWSLLQRITDNFSKQRLIGVGGCGEVYKGTLQNGNVAIKKFFKHRTIKEKMFHREVENLFTVRHHNIVRLLGYCSITEEEASPFNKRIIMAEERERLLCLEYISNGTLEKHLTDELRGLEWNTRYEIILGICKGLLYLHKEKDIIHMDLKPANVLLDDCMVPKITDFGLSRFENNSQTKTASRLISIGYCAPEYIRKGKSSSKSDIYSLGVLVTELVTGSKKKPDLTKVLRRWRHRWIKSSKHTPLGYQQVRKCLELAQRCIQFDPTSRPDIVDITQALDALVSKDDQFQEIPTLEDMLGIEPLDIKFPFELDPMISRSIELSNDTDGYIAFMIKARLRHHFCIEPNKGIVPPQSKCSVIIKMQAQVDELPNDHYKEKITVLSTRVDGVLAAMDGTGDMFIDKDRNLVDKVNVMIAFDAPPSDEEF